ncbi:MAG: hypothetical protein AB2417_02450 [Clostridiaceae bacterium]
MLDEILAKLMMAWVLFWGLIVSIKITIHVAKNKKRRDKKLKLGDVVQSKEIEPYYLQARDLFKDLMQQKSLNREQIIYIKVLIDERLGHYKKYYYKHYQNDAHEIYSKLKSAYLSIPDYKDIIQTLNTFK